MFLYSLYRQARIYTLFIACLECPFYVATVKSELLSHIQLLRKRCCSNWVHVNRSIAGCVCVCVFQWSPFQLPGLCSHNRADRPVIWSYAPWRYFTRHKHMNVVSQINRHFDLIHLFYEILLLRLSASSLQRCRAVVPSQFSRPVFLLPTGFVEWSSKIWGENLFARQPVVEELRGRFLPLQGNPGSLVVGVIFLHLENEMLGHVFPEHVL